MKRYLIVMIATLFALVSCGIETIEPTKVIDEPTLATIAFNLTANHPDATKAIKGGWESGDVIFVFFNHVAAPKFLKMSYNGTSWTSAEMDGSTVTAGALGLKNGDTGTMRAVFLPFGNDATVSASGTNFVFNKTWYTYYLTATLEYTVADNKVSGAFNMTIPDGYVQFFVEDAAATDEAYTLGCDAVIPTGVASVNSDGTVTETSNKTAADDMPGYAYSGGYLFSGKLGSWEYGSNYYFAKTKTDDNSRADYFVTGKTLYSHIAVKLPANDDIYAVVSGKPNNGKWVPVGSGTTVGLFASDLTTSLGLWDTCNYGQSVPEAYGTFYLFNEANALGATLPTKEQFELIADSGNCSYIRIKIHGLVGTVVKASRGFLFMPKQPNEDWSGGYWSCTEGGDINYGWCFIIGGSYHDVSNVARIRSYAIRPATMLIDLSTCTDNAVTIPSGTSATVIGARSDCVVTVEGGGSIVTLKDASFHCLVIQGNATIDVEGDNQLKTNSSSNVQAKGSVTFQGNGKLTTYSLSGTSGEYADISFKSGTYSIERYGITAKSINVAGGKITAQGLSGSSATAIKASDSIGITGGEVNATGDLIGIYVSAGNLTISGGIVNSEQTCVYNSANANTHAGIAVNQGTITISGGTVVAKGNYGSGIGGWSVGWGENLPAIANGILINGGDVTAESTQASVIGFCGTAYKSGPYCGDGGITITKDVARLKLVKTNTAAEMFRTNNTDPTCKITIDDVESPTSASTFEHLNLAVSTTTNENDTWTFTPKP